MIQTIILILLLLLGCAENANICQSEHGEKHRGGSKISKITITGDDKLQFDPKEFTVESGKKVELTFKNIGNMPHNLVILKKGITATDFGKMVAGWGGNGDINKIPELKKKIIAYTNIVKKCNEKCETIIFTAPEKETYEYVCTFAGHYTIMQGKMIVI